MSTIPSIRGFETHELTQLMNPPGVVQALQATIIFKHNAFILMKQYNKWL